MVIARRRLRARGMTLVEVMIALLVATVGLLGALAMIGTLVSGTSFSRTMSEATVLAQAKIEQVQSRNDVTVAGTLVPSNGPEPSEAPVNEGGVSFSRTTTWGTSADGKRRTVVVQVTWLDPLNRPHYVTAQTERIPNK